MDTRRAEARQVGRTVRPQTPPGSLRSAWWAQSWRTPRAPTCTDLRPFPPSSTTAPTAGEPGPLAFPWAWGAGGLWGDRTVSEPLSTPASCSPEHPRAFLDTSRDSTPIRSPENRERMIQRAGFPRKVPKGSRHAPLENRGPSSRNCQSCFPLALCLLSSRPPSPPRPSPCPLSFPPFALRLLTPDDSSCRLPPQSSLSLSSLCGLWHPVQQPETGARDGGGRGFAQPVARLPSHGLSPASGPRQPRPPCSPALASERRPRRGRLAGSSCRGADPALAAPGAWQREAHAHRGSRAFALGVVAEAGTMHLQQKAQAPWAGRRGQHVPRALGVCTKLWEDPAWRARASFPGRRAGSRSAAGSGPAPAPQVRRGGRCQVREACDL